MLKQLVSSAAALSIASASAPGATFYNVADVDLTSTSVSTNAEYIGTHPAYVAWDGTNAYLAGFNASGTAADTALVKVSDVLTAPTFGTRFGVQAAMPANRGFAGIDLRETAGVTTDIAATTDPGAAGTQRLFMYNAEGSERWNATPANRPPTGPAFDLTVDRISHMIQGSRTIRNNNVTTGDGTGTLDTNNNTAKGTLQYRDLDYNDLTGDAWTRDANDVIKATRTSTTSFAGTALLAANLADLQAVGQNIQYLTGVTGDDFAIFNDRGTTNNGQSFASVVKAVKDDGTAEALSFLSGDGSAAFAPNAGAAFYDFSWDSATQTLAISDFSNRRLYVFATTPVPEPAAAGLLTMAAAGLLRRRRRA